MGTIVQERESCKVDGINIVLDTLREVRGLAGFYLVKARTPAGQEVTLAMVGSSNAAERITAQIPLLAKSNPQANIAVINGVAELQPKRPSGKGGAA